MTAETRTNTQLSEQERALIDAEIEKIEQSTDFKAKGWKIVRGKDNRPAEVLFGPKEIDNFILINGKLMLAPPAEDADSAFAKEFEKGNLKHDYSQIINDFQPIKYGENKEIHVLIGVEKPSS